MDGRKVLKNAAQGLAATAAVAAAGYAALVVFNRARYGSAKLSDTAAKNSLLDRFIPAPEILERHSIDVNAPADVVMATAKEIELLDSPVIRALFRARELALGGKPDTRQHPNTLMEQMLSIGWVVLAERAGREVVFGSVTQPWETAPVFRSIPADDFLAFAEPGWVKIVWTLRADPIDDDRAAFQTETRVCTTDAAARERFRTYWSFVAPGVKLIRTAMLKPIKRAAEDRMRPAA
jgi:hypothetical protein